MPNPTKTNSEQGREWEKEFDFREQRIWQFAGQHPDFKHHTCELVKDFIRGLLAQQQSVLLKKRKYEK